MLCLGYQQVLIFGNQPLHPVIRPLPTAELVIVGFILPVSGVIKQLHA
jgi:hypothetical protein